MCTAQKWNVKVVFNRSCFHGNYECQILPVNQNLSSLHFSLTKFQLVSCNLSLAMIWQMTYTHKLPNCVQSPQWCCILLCVRVSVSIQMEDFSYLSDLVSSMVLFFGSLFFNWFLQYYFHRRRQQWRRGTSLAYKK